MPLGDIGGVASVLIITCQATDNHSVLVTTSAEHPNYIEVSSDQHLTNWNFNQLADLEIFPNLFEPINHIWSHHLLRSVSTNISPGPMQWRLSKVSSTK